MNHAALCVLITLAAGNAYASKPCEGVSREASAPALSERIAAQLRDPKAKAVQTFAYDGWSIVEVTLGGAHNAFLFYSSDPFSSDSIAVWRGDRDLDGVSQAKEWTVESAPAIPNQLARCFAVHVTARG